MCATGTGKAHQRFSNIPASFSSSSSPCRLGSPAVEQEHPQVPAKRKEVVVPLVI
jgi:hypothetical protein